MCSGCLSPGVHQRVALICWCAALQPIDVLYTDLVGLDYWDRCCTTGWRPGSCAHYRAYNSRGSRRYVPFWSDWWFGLIMKGTKTGIIIYRSVSMTSLQASTWTRITEQMMGPKKEGVWRCTPRAAHHAELIESSHLCICCSYIK